MNAIVWHMTHITLHFRQREICWEYGHFSPWTSSTRYNQPIVKMLPTVLFTTYFHNQLNRTTVFYDFLFCDVRLYGKRGGLRETGQQIRLLSLSKLSNKSTVRQIERKRHCLLNALAYNADSSPPCQCVTFTLSILDLFYYIKCIITLLQ